MPTFANLYTHLVYEDISWFLGVALIDDRMTVVDAIGGTFTETDNNLTSEDMEIELRELGGLAVLEEALQKYYPKR